MKKENARKTALLLYVATLLNLVSSAVNFLGHDDTSTGITFLCLGATFLCLGAAKTAEWKKAKQAEEHQSDEQEPPKE